MKMKRLSDETREKIMYGCFLGLVLFASSAVYVSFKKDAAVVMSLLPFVPVALVGYLLLGNLFIWIHERPESGKVSIWFKGSAAVYWTWLLTFAIIFIGAFLPGTARHIILVNAAVIIVCWVLDYCSFIKIAKELNGNVSKGRYLVVDLEECPKTVDAFCCEIEDYCRKNKKTLEFISRGKTAEILMDGEPYQVELDSFYSQFGPMYALKFKQKATK